MADRVMDCSSGLRAQQKKEGHNTFAVRISVADRKKRNRDDKGDGHQIWRTQGVQVNGASLRLFLRSSTGPNRAFEPQSLGRVRDPVRIAEGPTHDFGFSILDFGLRTEATRVSLPEAPVRGEGFLVDSLHEGERTGPPTLWYLGNVDGPRCHANQVVPATGLVDDAITTARKKSIVDQAGKPDLLPCRGNGFPAIRRRLTHGRVRYISRRMVHCGQLFPQFLRGPLE